jgi:hypothetical protein
MNKLIAIGALTLGVGLGAWGGYQVGSVESSAAAAGIDRAPMTRESLSAGRAAVDSAALRALIREEMAAALAVRSGSGAAAPQAEAARAATGARKEAVSPEILEQRRDAQQQIDTIVSQGVWGNDQRLSFQQHLVKLDPEEKERALQRITTAINNGALQVSTDGPPL